MKLHVLPLSTAIAALSLITCSPRPLSGLVVGFATDLVATKGQPPPKDPLYSVQFTIWSPPSAPKPRATIPIAPAVLPTFHEVYALDGSPEVRLDLVGTLKSGRTVTRSTVVQLSALQTRFIRLTLQAICVEKEAQCVGTCVEGYCLPTLVGVAAEHLPLYEKKSADGKIPGLEGRLQCTSYDAARVPINKKPMQLSDPTPAPACASEKCIEGVCYGSPDDRCRDGEKNGLETDVDCGGGTCQPCANGGVCLRNDDCRGGSCQNNRCEEPAYCDDGLRSGLETDIDCGGVACTARCGGGKGCQQNRDCISFSCVSQHCDEPAECGNGAQDEGEGGPDCGGFCKSLCMPQSPCAADRDCLGGNCNAGTCANPDCSNHKRDGDEVDVDCAGSCKVRCGAGRTCGRNEDCQSGVCGMDNHCEPPQCSDGVKNGDETDVDCGGGCARAQGKACPPNRECKTGDDCDSRVCKMNVCQVANCSDGVQNGGECAVDHGPVCGDPPCPP